MYLKCPSGKEATENICKGEDSDWADLLSGTF